MFGGENARPARYRVVEAHSKLDAPADGAATPGVDERDLLTTAEAARVLRVAPKFVYSHARELGGFRLLGDRGPWRFAHRDLLARSSFAPELVLSHRTRARAAARGHKQTHTPSGAPLLPSEPRGEAR